VPIADIMLLKLYALKAN